MKKLSMDLEKLAVETFVPDAAPDAQIGTVNGYAYATRGTCAGIPTCVSPDCATTLAI